MKDNENENIKPAVDLLAKSLDDMQKNATDTQSTVNQVMLMSGKELHDKIVAAILADPALSRSEKQTLIDIENEKYDGRQDNCTERVIRLQTTKTQNVSTASSGWSKYWGWAFGGGVVLLCVATPSGRQLVTRAVKR